VGETAVATDRAAAPPAVEAGRALGALCLLQIALWTLAPAVSHTSPPLDVVENGAWGPEWVIATFKNPTLAIWLVELGRLATGSVGWPAYLLSQLCVTATFLLVYRLGREALGPAPALAGTALLTGVIYLGWTTPEFNQDVASVPLWAAVTLALWRAVATGRPLWWLALGLAAALGVYAKLSTAVLLVTAGVWLLADGAARARLASPWPWAGLALFAVLVAPLVVWLIRNDFPMLEYAAMRGRTNSLSPVGFAIAQIEALLPMLGMLALAAYLGRDDAVRDGPPPVDRRFLRYLMVMTFGPTLVTLAVTVLMHTGIKRMWGVPMLSNAGLLAMIFAGRFLGPDAARRILRFATALLVALPIAYVLRIAVVPPLTGELPRQLWPQAEIEAGMRGIWAAETGNKPLRIVAGEVTNWIAGQIALGTNGFPPASVFTEADMQRSPWVTPERLAREGALVVWQERGEGPPANLLSLIGSREPRFAEFSPAHYRKPVSIKIGYVVVPPRS
jgi:4-amino-4-deoxy-L-arabinose transferase-like glycosyltransferase